MVSSRVASSVDQLHLRSATYVLGNERNGVELTTDNSPLTTTSTDARLGRIVRLSATTPPWWSVARASPKNWHQPFRSVARRAASARIGLQITGRPATGSRLSPFLISSSLNPGAGGPRLDLRLAPPPYFRVGSHVVAVQAAADGEPEGAVFLAEQQTAGQGRGGHTWESERSLGIYVSVVLRPALTPAEALLLSLMAGIAVAEAVEQTTGLHPDLRWPNDVLLNGRKFCGILTEMNAEPTRVRYVVVGVGINVNQPSFSGELEAIATSLRLEGRREWSRVDLTAALLKIARQRVPQARRRRRLNSCRHIAAI